MKEEIEKLITRYKGRKLLSLARIAEIKKLPPSSQDMKELHSANLARILWSEVIKDLEKIADKF